MHSIFSGKTGKPYSGLFVQTLNIGVKRNISFPGFRLSPE
jgi:hypothetical protein